MKTKISIRECIAQEYTQLAIDFKNEVTKLGESVRGIQAPHIPIAGKNYELAKYKIAIVGMETYGWEDLEDFMQLMETNPSAAVLNCQDWLDPKGILKRNGNATFWGFVIKFIEKFYKINHATMMDRQNPHPCLSSFVWAETNSIERYHVTAQKNGISQQLWKNVKDLSKPLDSINHLIDSTHPKVVIITDKWVSDDYIFNLKDINTKIPDTKNFVFAQQINDRVPYQLYYLRDKNVYAFVIPHPRWIGLHGLTDSYIESMIQTLDNAKIWDTLPTSEQDWMQQPEEANTSISKYQFVADVANFLIDHNMTITGVQLAELLNSKGYRTKYNTKYKTDSSRAILTRIVQPAWAYYYRLKDYQLAMKISRAFTDKWGKLAWDK